MGSRPLRVLIPAAVFALGLVLIGLIAALELWSDFRRAENEGLARARLLGSVVAASVENALRRASPGDAADGFARLSTERRLELGVLLDHRDSVMLSTSLALRDLPLEDTVFAGHAALFEQVRNSMLARVLVDDTGTAIVGVFPVRLAPLPGELVPSRVGVLATRASLRPAKHAALSETVSTVGTVGALLLLCCLAGWWCLHVGLVRRIQQLASATEQIARGEQGVRSALTGNDELAALASAFDHMADTLDTRAALLNESRAFLAAVLDAVPANIAVLDASGRVVAVNHGWCEFALNNGLAGPGAGVGSNYLDVCDRASGRFAQGAAEVAHAIRAMFDGTRSEFRMEYPCPSRSEERWFSLHLTRFETSGVNQVLATHVDTTAVKRAERALAVEEQRYRTLYDHNPSMFFTLAPDGTILSVNDFGATELGYEAGDLLGTPAARLYDPRDWPVVAENLAAFADTGDEVRRWQVRKRRRDGRELWVRESARALDAGNPGGYSVLVVCEDVTELQEISVQLKHQASHDALTGLINRYEFEQRLRDAVQEAADGQGEHVLCYVDLDQFKVINDTCGHLAGDELLRQVSGMIRATLRKGDSLARLGGDEFGVLIPRCPLDRGREIAESVRAVIADFSFSWEGHNFALGCSIGVTGIDASTQSTTNALSAADAACYSAKDEGRNRVHVYRPDDIELTRRHGEMQWVSRLQDALAEDRFELAYQLIEPAARHGGDTGSYYELLLRLRSESGESIAPGRFLPAAERYNLATRLDRWVLDRALTLLAACPRHLETLKHCGINLSGQSVGDEAFLGFAVERVRDSGVPPSCLCFEITETAAIGNLTRAGRFIETLSALGCRFALDDFGSGLSSFAYLKHLPVHFVKIDGVFVNDMEDDPLDAAMVGSINQIGQLMGKRTIAEFVETTVIAERLRELGVDFLQGYAIARPRSFQALLEEAGTEARSAR